MPKRCWVIGNRLCMLYRFENSFSLKDINALHLLHYNWLGYYYALQAFHTEVQTRVSAICDTQAHSSRSYFYTVCKGEIWRREFQSKTILSLPHHYLYNLILCGTLCPGLVLCGLQRFASAIQSSAQVYHNQICSISYLLAGMILVEHFKYT